MTADLRVFVSYSRRDLAFVDALDAALRARDVEPLIDRAEIYAFEDWWRRIEDLIVKADTIVFVLSPDAVASDVCAREVAFASSLNKRLAPVVARAVDPARVPAELSRLNFVRLDQPGAFEAGIERLVEALSTDIEWVRRHSEFGEVARRWVTAGRPGPQGLLLRSPVLEDAERWIATRPANAPVPTPDTQSLILTSRRATSRRRRAISTALAIGLALALALSGLALWQRQVARQNEGLAIAARQAEEQQRRLAEERERQAIEASNRVLVGQSRFLADLAARSLQDGDNGSAVLFGLAALPDRTLGVARPVVPEAERDLDRALATLRERGLAVRHAGFLLGFSPDGRWAVSFGGGEQVLADLAGSETTRTRLPGEVVAFAFSPDSRRLVRCSADRVDVVGLAGQPERSIDVAAGGTLAPGTLQTCRFGSDGRSVVAVGSDGEVGWWNAETGSPDTRFTVPPGPGGLQVSRDGRRLASVGADGAARVYDAGSGRQVAVLAASGTAPDHVDLGTDGSRALTTGGGSDVARVWNVASATVLAALSSTKTDGLLGPDGRTVVLRDRPNTAGIAAGGFEIWDVATGERRATADPAMRLTSLAFGPDGSRLVAGGPDGAIRVFETATGRQVTRLVGHQSRVIAAALSPDGRQVLSSAFDSRLVLWTLDAERPSRRLQVAAAVVTAVVPLDDGRRFLAASRDGTLRRWDVGEARAVADLVAAGPPIAALASAPGSDRLLSVRRDGSVALIAASDGQIVATYAAAAEPDLLDGPDADRMFAPDGTRFVVRSGPDTVAMRRALDGALVWESHTTLDPDGGVFVTPDGARVVAWSAAGAADILDARTGARLATLRNTPLGPEGSPLPGTTADDILPWTTLRASPDGRRLVSDGPLQPRVWNLETGETERILVEHAIAGDPVRMRFGPDPDTVFTVEAGRTVTAWDLASATRIRSFVGHARPITALRVSPDGQRLLTASEDGTVRLWDVASGIEHAAFSTGAGPILDARFWAPDGIAATPSDGSVRIWSVAPDIQALVDQAKAAMSRCLAPAQRRRAYLDPAPPAWCVTGPGRERETDPRRWQPRTPYQMPIWERWYQATQRGAPVPLPQSE